MIENDELYQKIFNLREHLDTVLKAIKEKDAYERLKKDFNDEDITTLLYLLSLDNTHQSQVLMFNQPAQILWDKFMKLQGSKLDPESSNKTE